MFFLLSRKMRLKYKTSFKYIKSYFKQSSIAVLHFRHSKVYHLEQLFFSLLAALLFITVSIIISATLTRYFSNPTVITIERDHFNWSINFPAATICPTSKINRELVDYFVQFSTVSNKTLLKEFMLSLASGTYDNFENIPYIDEIFAEQYLTLLQEMQYIFQPSFQTSAGVALKLQPVISEMGICYTINSNMGVYNSPSYWENDSWSLLEKKEVFKVHYLDGESFINVINITSGFKVYVVYYLEVRLCTFSCRFIFMDQTKLRI